MAILAVILCTGCNTTKYLSADQSLLKKNDVVFLGDVSKAEKATLGKDLALFIEAQPNKKFLGVPREYFFFKSKANLNASSWNNWANKNFGAEPVYYENQKIESAVQLMKQFLQFKKGYYSAEVDYLDETVKGKTTVTYLVKPNQRSTIKSISFISKDTAVVSAIQTLSSEPKIKAGDPIDADVFDLEKQRISDGLQDVGYSDFYPQYIDVKGDSTGLNHQVNIFLEILPPTDSEKHPIYRNGYVSVYTDAYNKQDTFSLMREDVNGIRFYRESMKYLVRPSVLENAITFTPGELSSKTPRIQSFNRLSSLSAYRFASIYARPNPEDSTLINYDIYLTPQDKKWIFDISGESYYSTIYALAGSNRNLVGLTLNSQLVDRNFLKGSEKYTLSGELGGEFTLTNPIIPRSWNTSLNNSLELPRFSDPLHLFRGVRKTGLLSQRNYDLFTENATSIFNLGFSYIDVLNLYQNTTIGGAFGYKYTDGTSRSLTLNQTSISLNEYDLRDSFPTNIPSLVLSFQNNLFTGLVFSDFFYTFNKTVGNTGYNYGIITSLQTSGLEVFAANKLSNLVSGSNQDWTVGRDFQFAKFVRFDLDVRGGKVLGPNSNMAARAFGGIIVPYGDNSATPYPRQFSVGGPNSLRGWYPRQIGPGGNTSSLQDTIGGLYFQQGDIRLEANIEYRFGIYKFLEGAVFVDAGNVWRLNGDKAQNENFTINFLDQIAISAGYGIRFDFDYFIIRGDFAFRLRNPYVHPEEGWQWYNWSRIRKQRLGNLQIGINYPF